MSLNLTKETIAVHVYLAKQMTDKIQVKENEWRYSDAASSFEGILRLTAAFAADKFKGRS